MLCENSNSVLNSQTKCLRSKDDIMSGAIIVLVSCVCQERQTELNQFFIERHQLRIAGIDRHNRRNPLNQNGPIGFCPSQTVQSVSTVWIDRSTEQKVGVQSHVFSDEFRSEERRVGKECRIGR